LCCGHFVVARKVQLVVLQTEDRVGAPFVGIVGTTARTEPASPFIGKEYLRTVVRERGGVPVGVVGIVHSIEALPVHGILDVEHYTVAGTRASRQTDGRIPRNVMALVSIFRLDRAFLPMAAAAGESIDRARAGIDEYARARHNLGILGRGHW